MAEAEALFEAIRKGDIDVVRQSITGNSALAGAKNETGISALFFALYCGRSDIAEVIASGRPRLDLFEAAALGRLDVVDDVTMRDGALARAFSIDGFTALHFAVFLGQPVAAALLLERGANLEAIARNAMLVRPIHSAAASRSVEAVAVLVAAGADVSACQQKGYTPLHSAAQQGNEPMARLLLAAGADPKAKSDDGQSAVDLARSKGHEALAALLEARG